MESKRPRGRPPLHKPETVLKSVRMKPEAWRWRDSLAKALNIGKTDVMEDALRDMMKKHKLPLD